MEYQNIREEEKTFEGMMAKHCPNLVNTRIPLIQTQQTLSRINKEHYKKEHHKQIAENKQNKILKAARENDTYVQRKKCIKITTDLSSEIMETS